MEASRGPTNIPIRVDEGRVNVGPHAIGHLFIEIHEEDNLIS
jgi:hypothetical protein